MFKESNKLEGWSRNKMCAKDVSLDIESRGPIIPNWGNNGSLESRAYIPERIFVGDNL